ncbi:hypothetical protein ELI13_34565 [Rhizobium ruizarguesonis]|uniref:Phytanoyl-CoA dioxygenase family protein n=1 Tax=Rhizobium ruizarguesonis TaxID=2081791 RepID=A0ABY1WXQ2_9HYPH|nr:MULTISPECIES: hypothetical protein [Rhizobium]TAU60415.1 hypothetical protein ELI46_35345 [Rhizobium ruizarguesonis]TAU60546.1 hypothetical protein ELI46_36270 [Rhizobium ruizarguesonis]TAU93556.1 hypothetical protein ELI37_34025 [Rhizobium leguminosarum]TAV19535.1 hypothetical protein ELI36_36520 [Rhizobium ruizarguesonis]TAV21676.1 hypothetical protein ELI33_35175 [Rhizobium ruizarguesonis]
MTLETASPVQPNSHGGTPFGEMWRVAEQNPAYSLLEVLDSIDRDAWDIETPSADQRGVYARVNGQAALRRLREAMKGMQDEYPLDAPPRRRQWLASGCHIRVEAVLDARQVRELAGHCDHLLHTAGMRPVRLFENPQILSEETIAAIARTALAALPQSLSSSARPALLKRRTLLRRTFSPAQLPNAHGNANNQFWHQDSNQKFNDAPMLTLWIPLQGGAGRTCPGLEVIDAPVSYFSILHGDSSQTVCPILSDMFPGTKITSLEAAAGDCVMFNGLTFHQTATNTEMREHRDVLLIRIIEAADAAHFGPNGAADGIVPLV